MSEIISSELISNSNTLEQACSRLVEDRRKATMKSAIYSLFRRRRAVVRRDGEEAKPQYFDIHEPWVKLTMLAVLGMSCMDSIFTLKLLQLGSSELNPVMKYFIDLDSGLFFAVKLFLTSFCVMFIVMHKKFRLFKLISGYHMLIGTLVMYVTLISYELSMLTGVLNIFV